LVQLRELKLLWESNNAELMNFKKLMGYMHAHSYPS